MHFTTKQLTIAAIVVALVLMTARGKESYTDDDKKTCLSKAKESTWDKYDFDVRQQKDGKWKCAEGWQDTKCDWGMGAEFEQKQCRKEKDSGGSDSGSGDDARSTCRSRAKKSLWDKYDWQNRRQTSNGNWRCPQGWEDTKCDWGMGAEFEQKQCRRARSTRIESEITGSLCSQNSDCSNGRVCVDGYCNEKFDKNTGKGYCTKNSHCGRGMKCRSNKCAFAEIESMCGDVNNNEKPLKILEALTDWSPQFKNYFIIVSFVGKSGIATGNYQQHAIACGNRWYHAFMWAPGEKGTFEHKNSNGWENWAMAGGKFNEGWRQTTDKNYVVIDN